MEIMRHANNESQFMPFGVWLQQMLATNRDIEVSTLVLEDIEVSTMVPEDIEERKL